jgi:hypothetical protein
VQDQPTLEICYGSRTGIVRSDGVRLAKPLNPGVSKDLAHDEVSVSHSEAEARDAGHLHWEAELSTRLHGRRPRAPRHVASAARSELQALHQSAHEPPLGRQKERNDWRGR